MTFFYDLNKRLAALAVKQEQEQIAESKKAEAVAQSPLTQALNESAIAERSTGDYSAKKARAGKDIGKPGKAFAKIAKSAGEKYGSKAAGERVAGAVLNKLRHPKEDIENEGNAFTGALAKTPKGGKFKVGSKEFTDTSSIEEADVLGQFEDEMTPKQKAFAKLAPPKDKITFADKIAGAKKEVDEMLGDVAAEAMRAALGKGKKVVADEDGIPSSTGGTIHKTKTGLRHVAGKNYGALDVSNDDDENDDKPKVKGRPKGSKRAIGAKVKGTSKLHRQPAIAEEHDEHVCEMCGQPIAEKAVSKKQQKFMGMVHAAQKGEKPASKEVAKVAKEMPKKAAKDFAATKHKGLPEKVKSKKEESKEEVEETTTSGSVATASAAPKAGKGMAFGKGVYESLDKQFKQALSESISVQETVAECGDVMPGLAPEKGLTIQASGEDAIKLMQLLKLAGLAGGEETCPGCGHSPCDCDSEMVDENKPNWPTDEETLAADPNLRTYSGGLNGPKSTGQTTTPVIASQLRRQASMEESVKLENTLADLYKNYKG